MHYYRSENRTFHTLVLTCSMTDHRPVRPSLPLYSSISMISGACEEERTGEPFRFRHRCQMSVVLERQAWPVPKSSHVQSASGQFQSIGQKCKPTYDWSETTYHAASDNEPYHDRHLLSQSQCIRAFHSILIEHLGPEVFLTCREVEDGTYTNWPKESCDPSFSPSFRMVNAFV